MSKYSCLVWYLVRLSEVPRTWIVLDDIFLGHLNPGIWTFEDWLVQIPSPWGKKAVQMPHQLVLKYLSSKANFVFNQTLFTLFREREREVCRYVTFKLLLRPFWKSYSVKPYKKKTHGCITLEQEINPDQIPHPYKATFKYLFPLPGHDAQSKASIWPVHNIYDSFMAHFWGPAPFDQNSNIFSLFWIIMFTH